MTAVRSALEDGERRLAAARVEDPRADAERLLAAVLGTDRWRLRFELGREVPPNALDAFRARLDRRCRREPLQYVLGECEFYGLVFAVDRRVLIPRPETEGIVDRAVRAFESGNLRADAAVADIGTGSGALAIVLAHRFPGWRIAAVDLSPEAIALARENAARHGVADRIDFRCGDALAPLGEASVDLLVANPPYVTTAEFPDLQPEVRDWEPPLALLAGADGLDVIRPLIFSAPGVVRAGGRMLLEIGHRQEGAVREIVRAEPRWGDPEFHRDLGGILRVVEVQRRPG